MGTWGLVGGSRTTLRTPKDLAPSLSSSWLSHRSVYSAQCLFHLLASSRLPGRWLLSPLCAMPAIWTTFPAAVLGYCVPGQPDPSRFLSHLLPSQPLSVSELPQTFSSSTWEVASFSTQSPGVPLSLPAPPLLPPPAVTQLPGLPSTAGSHACLFLASSHPCRHLESSFPPTPWPCRTIWPPPAQPP